MGKNRYGGNKAKRKKNNTSHSVDTIYKQEGQIYGRVDESLGNKRFKVFCNDGSSRIGILSGAIKTWINKEDIVLINLWEFQDNKCSIIHKYNDENINDLILSNEITEKFKTNGNNFYSDDMDDTPFEWDRNEEETIIKSTSTDYLSKSLMPLESDEEEINIDDI